VSHPLRSFGIALALSLVLVACASEPTERSVPPVSRQQSLLPDDPPVEPMPPCPDPCQIRKPICPTPGPREPDLTSFEPSDSISGGGAPFLGYGCRWGECEDGPGDDCDPPPDPSEVGTDACFLRAQPTSCPPTLCRPENPLISTPTNADLVDIFGALVLAPVPPECQAAFSFEDCEQHEANALDIALQRFPEAAWITFCSNIRGLGSDSLTCDNGRFCGVTSTGYYCLVCNEEGQCRRERRLDGTGQSSPPSQPPPTSTEPDAGVPVPPTPPKSQAGQPTEPPPPREPGTPVPAPVSNDQPPPVPAPATGGTSDAKGNPASNAGEAQSSDPPEAAEWPHRIRQWEPPEPALPAPPAPPSNPDPWYRETEDGPRQWSGPRQATHLNHCIEGFPCPAWSYRDSTTGQPTLVRVPLPLDIGADRPFGRDAEPPARAGDPVLVGSGQIDLAVTDLEIPARGGLHFRLDRMYSSGGVTQGDLGRNWMHGYEERLDLVNEFTGSAYLPDYCFQSLPAIRCIEHHYGPQQAQVFIQDPVSLVFMPPPGSFSSIALVTEDLTQSATGKLIHQSSYVLRDAHGNLTAFDETGRLTSKRDRHGSVMNFAYDAAGRLAVVYDPLFRPIRFAYDAEGNLEWVTDFSGRKVHYEYRDFTPVDLYLPFALADTFGLPSSALPGALQRQYGLEIVTHSTPAPFARTEVWKYGYLRARELRPRLAAAQQHGAQLRQRERAHHR